MEKIEAWVKANPIKAGAIALIILGVVLTVAVNTPSPDQQPEAIAESVNE